MAVYEGVNASRSKSTDAKHIITVLASRMMLFWVSTCCTTVENNDC
jgi:hypothetical protein